jgi:hypothetical protein
MITPKGKEVGARFHVRFRTWSREVPGQSREVPGQSRAILDQICRTAPLAALVASMA